MMWLHKILVIAAVTADPVVALASKHAGTMRGHRVAVAETVFETATEAATETVTETDVMWHSATTT